MPGARAGRDDDEGAFDHRVITQVNRGIRDVKLRGGDAESQRHVAAFDVLGRRQRRPLGPPLAHQYVLRKRRAVIGGVKFVANQSDRSRETVSAKGFDEPPPGETRADHDDVVFGSERRQENMASHCSRVVGASTKLCLRTSPMGELDSGE